MSASNLVGKHASILVSDPWEFGTECGVGPFAGTVVAAETEVLVLKLDVPILYRGAQLRSVVARPRHVGNDFDRTPPIGSELSVNLSLRPALIGAVSELTEAAWAGEVGGIGSVTVQP